MTGWDKILRAMEEMLQALDFDYHIEPHVKTRVKTALIMANIAKDIVNPKDSRVGRESISTEIKKLTIRVVSLDSALKSNNISGNRVNIVIGDIKKQCHNVIRLLMAKKSVEQVDRKTNKINDTNLRSSLSQNMVEVKGSSSRATAAKFDPEASQQYSQLQEVNEGFIAEGLAFKAWISKRKLYKPRIMFTKISLVVLAEPSIPSNRLSVTGIDYVLMAGVLILKNQQVAIIHNQDRDVPIGREAQDRAEEKYNKRFVNVLAETASSQEFLAIRGLPTCKLIWLLDREHYSKIGGFKLKELGFPWN